MSNVIDLRHARCWRGSRKAENIRVQFPDGFAYYESLGAALADIHRAVQDGQRAFVIDIRQLPPDETEHDSAL